MAQIDVPWAVGRPVVSGPVATPTRPGRAATCHGKAEQLRRDLEVLSRWVARAKAQGQKARRERLQEELAFQEQRIAWLEAAAEASRESLEARLGEIWEEVGEEGLGYLENGLPKEFRNDRRLLYALGEAAIVMHALEAS